MRHVIRANSGLSCLRASGVSINRLLRAQCGWLALMVKAINQQHVRSDLTCPSSCTKGLTRSCLTVAAALALRPDASSSIVGQTLICLRVGADMPVT